MASVPPRRDFDFSGHTVLVIDDHDDSLLLLVEMLRHCGADVIGARDAEEARQVIRERAPSVILTDINLPRETGFEFAEWVRREAPEPVRKTPIIAITATSPVIALRPPPTVDAIVRKPVELDELCRLIDDVLKQQGRRA